jgi:hypothetical protein
MKWVTRRKARAEFLFVAEDEVTDTARREGALPFDVPGVELGHHGDRCSFDAFLDKYELIDPALRALGQIVRGADTEARSIAREAWGLALQFPVYDALYAYCRADRA